MSAVAAGGAPASTTWPSAWADALAELEMSVDEAESLLRAVHGSDDRAAPVAAAVMVASAWTPPSHLGVLPAPLLERATALLGRQVELATRLAHAAAHSRRQMRAVEGMRVVAETNPLYLDTAG